MEAVLLPSHKHSPWLGWAILISMCLHIGIMVFVPKWEQDKKEQTIDPIEVELMQAAPISQAEPTPPAPEPEPKLQPKPSEITKPKKSVVPQAIQPPTPISEPTPSPVIAVAPTK